MSENARTKFADWVKANSSVSEVAKDLKKSRPTIYKMMELYDEGKAEALPEEVVAYFEKKLAEGESKTVIEMKAKLTEKMMMLSDRISFQQSRIPEILREKAMLARDYADLSKKMDEESDEEAKKKIRCEQSELEVRQKNFESRLASETMELESLKASYEDCRERLAHYDSSVTSVLLDNKETYPIKSTCTIEGCRCMIIHNGKTEMLDYMFHLQIYGKVGDDFVFLKEYRSKAIAEYDNEWDSEPIGYYPCNYFIIDDFLFSAPLYYKIVEYGEGEYNEENTSGMRPLKQSH